MKATKRKSLLIMTLAAFMLSTGTLAVTTFSAKAEDNGVNLIEDMGSEMTNADYTLKSYSFRWNDDTKYGETDDFDSGYSALRFTMSMSGTLYNLITEANAAEQTEGAGITTGTLILPLYYMNGGVAELTHAKVTDDKTTSAIDVDTTTAWTSDDNGTTYQNVTCLSKIPYEFYNAPIAVRGYVKAVIPDTEAGGFSTEYYYTDVTDQNSFSLSELAFKEYNKEESNLASKKEAIKDALMKFKFKLDGVLSEDPVYYGDKVSPEEQVGKVNVYTNTAGTAIWDSETNIIKGNTALTLKSYDAKQYYSKATDTATFTATGVDASTTKATINGAEVDVTVEGENVTVAGLNALQLTVGKTYLMQVGNQKLGFTYVTAINDYVPYSNKDKLWFKELGDYETTAIEIPAIALMNKGTVIVSDLDGNTDWNGSGGNLKAVAWPADKKILKLTECDNGTQYPNIDSDEVLVTKGEDVYKITPYIYRDVIYTVNEGKAFFASKTPTWQTEGNGRSYALAQDLDIGEITGKGAMTTNQAFIGIFDGCGHTLTYTVDGATATSASQDTTLFGYHFYGQMRNTEVEIVYNNVATDVATGKPKTYNIISQFLSDEAAVIENSVFNIKEGSNCVAENMTQSTFALCHTSVGMALKDVAILHDFSGKLYASNRLLFHSYSEKLLTYDSTATPNPTPTTAGAEILTADTVNTGKAMVSGGSSTNPDDLREYTLYDMSTSIFNTDNLVAILPDGDDGLWTIGATADIGCGYSGVSVGIGATNDKELGYTGYYKGCGIGWYRARAIYLNNSYIYNFADVKENGKQVGSWKITYGDTIKDVTVSYVG